MKHWPFKAPKFFKKKKKNSVVCVRERPPLFGQVRANNCTHEAEWTLFQTDYFSDNLVAPGIELGPLDL
jgi:hypothetical protein